MPKKTFSDDTRLVDLTVGDLRALLSDRDGDLLVKVAAIVHGAQGTVGDAPQGYDIKTTAKLLSQSPRTISRRIKEKKLAATKVGKKWVVTREEVERVRESGIPM